MTDIVIPGRREVVRGKVLIPGSWLQFSRAAQARAMTVYALEVIAKTAFTGLSRKVACEEALECHDKWLPEQLQSLMIEFAAAEDAGRTVPLVRIEDPRDVADGYGGDPCSCSLCEEYFAPLPSWCKEPHSDGKSINEERPLKHPREE